MASLRSVNDYVARIGSGYRHNAHYRVEIDAATTATLFSNQVQSVQKFPNIHVLPSLPTGVTGYRLTNFTLDSSAVAQFQLAKLVNMGSIDISGASGTYTSGSSMPTVTEGNASVATCSAIIAEVTTALNATPGTLTVTYVDQSGNTAEAAAALTLTASAAAKTCGPIILNSGDYGARSISTVTRAAGTTPSGVIQFWGIVPLGPTRNIWIVGTTAQTNFMFVDLPPPLLAATDTLAVFCFNSSTAKHIHGTLSFVGDQA